MSQVASGSLKFLADEQFPRLATEMAIRLGWDVWEVTERPKLRAGDDVEVVLAYAKRVGRILLSADGFEDHQTRTSMQANIRRTRRGRVLSVAGGPEQGWQRIMGKLLVHMDRWEEFFVQGHGWVKIGDAKAESLRMTRPNQLPKVVHQQRVQGEAYLKTARQKPLPGMRPQRTPKPRASAPLPEG